MGRKTKIKQQRKELTVVLGQMEAQATLKARHQAAAELNWIVDDVLKVADLNQDIRDLCYFCSEAAAGYRGKELIEKLPESAAGDLMSMLTQVALVFERLNADVTPVRNLVMPYVSGIRALHNDHDDGEQLRTIDAGEGINLIKRLRASIGGRKAGKTSWRDKLRGLWIELEMEHTDWTAAEIRRYIIDKIAQLKPDFSPPSETGKVRQYTSADYVMRPGTDTDDRDILNALMKDTPQKNPGDFRDKLFRMNNEY